MPWESVVYRRDKLYEQVWLEPARSVARHYGISDVALGKICRKLEVPLPGRGYWARKAAGQEIPRAPLPELKKGQPAQLQSARYVEPSTTQSFGEDTNERIRREADPAHKINLAYSSPLRDRFAWEGEASTADLVNVVLFPYRQKPDDPDETPA
jgi:hypothetical protein